VAGADYEHQFVRNPNPPEVTYIRSMAFEHAINTVNSGRFQFNFNLDHAYWMSGLEPVDRAKGVARFDGLSLAIPDPARTTLPESGPPACPGQGCPYAMVGQRWLLGQGATSNGFRATVSAAMAVTLHTVGMHIDNSRRVTGQISTDSPLALTLAGNWPSSLTVQIDGSPVTFQPSSGAIEINAPAGQHTVSIRPG
jgi:hypothetical protein